MEIATLTGSSTAETTWQLVRMMLAVVGVCVLAVLTMRLISKKITMKSGGDYIHIIESVNVGQNRALCLAWVSGQVLLLGISDQGISKLCDVDELIKSDRSSSDGHSENSFFSRLSEIMSTKSQDGTEKPDGFKYLGRLK